jgi:hypothetical protein
MKKLLVAAFAVALVVAFAAPAFAFDYSFGARVRTNFGYTFASEERTQNGTDSTVRGFFNVSSSSYIRTTFNSKDKMVGVRAEIGLGGTVTRRTVFGWYNIGNCKLVAGNNYTWAGDGVLGHSSWLTDLTTGGVGLNYFGRMPMIAVEWREGNFGVQVGIFEPTDGGVATANDFGWYLPQLHITGDLKFAMFQMAPAVAIVNYQWESTVAGGDSSYTAWYVGLPVKGTFGPVTVAANLYYAVNGANDFGGNALADVALSPAGQTEDSTQYGGFVEVAYSAGPMKLAGGIGMTRVQNDEWRRSFGWSDDSTTWWKAYLTMVYKLHANLDLRPEIGYADYGDSPVTGLDAGNEFLVGLRFQFLF